MLKEVASYEKEAKTNESKIQKMRDDGRDIYGTVIRNLFSRLNCYLELFRYTKTRRSTSRKLYDDS